MALEEVRPDVPDFVPSPIARLLRICWATDPTKRPVFSRILTALDQIMQLMAAGKPLI